MERSIIALYLDFNVLLQVPMYEENSKLTLMMLIIPIQFLLFTKINDLKHQYAIG